MSKSEKIAKLQKELQEDADRNARIKELSAELKLYGYVIERKKVKEKKEELARGISSCIFWVGVLLALPLASSGIGYQQAEISGALIGAGIGVGLAMVLMLAIQALCDIAK